MSLSHQPPTSHIHLHTSTHPHYCVVVHRCAAVAAEAGTCLVACATKAAQVQAGYLQRTLHTSPGSCVLTFLGGPITKGESWA
jgi:hypothetical protein